MSKSTQTPTRREDPRCMRCGGELPAGSGYVHLQLDRCVEVLGRKVQELEKRAESSDVASGRRWR